MILSLILGYCLNITWVVEQDMSFSGNYIIPNIRRMLFELYFSGTSLGEAPPHRDFIAPDLCVGLGTRLPGQSSHARILCRHYNQE
jgi:hypothetical protein